MYANCRECNKVFQIRFKNFEDEKKEESKSILCYSCWSKKHDVNSSHSHSTYDVDDYDEIDCVSGWKRNKNKKKRRYRDL